MGKKAHIDDVQPATIDEHERLLVEDETIIDSKFTPVTSADLPEWFNEKLFKAGQSYYMRNLLGMGVANVTGLIAVLSIPSILKILVLTNQSSIVCSAFRRYAQTVLHIYALNCVDILDPKWYKSLNVIRWKHAIASKRSKKCGLVGIYQKDMALTQFGFIGYPLVLPNVFALTNKPDEAEALNHCWRIIGYMLDIPDRLNICRKTAAETTELCNRILHKMIKNHMDQASAECLTMSCLAVQGLSYINIMLDADAFVNFTFHISGSKYEKELSIRSQLFMKYQNFIFYLCAIPYIGAIVKTLYNYILMFTFWTLERYPIVARIAFGKADSTICLYPNITQ